MGFAEPDFLEEKSYNRGGVSWNPEVSFPDDIRSDAVDVGFNSEDDVQTADDKTIDPVMGYEDGGPEEDDADYLRRDSLTTLNTHNEVADMAERASLVSLEDIQKRQFEVQQKLTLTRAAVDAATRDKESIINLLKILAHDQEEAMALVQEYVDEGLSEHPVEPDSSKIEALIQRVRHSTATQIENDLQDLTRTRNQEPTTVSADGVTPARYTDTMQATPNWAADTRLLTGTKSAASRLNDTQQRFGESAAPRVSRTLQLRDANAVPSAPNRFNSQGRAASSGSTYDASASGAIRRGPGGRRSRTPSRTGDQSSGSSIQSRGSWVGDDSTLDQAYQRLSNDIDEKTQAARSSEKQLKAKLSAVRRQSKSQQRNGGGTQDTNQSTKINEENVLTRNYVKDLMAVTETSRVHQNAREASRQRSMERESVTKDEGAEDWVECMDANSQKPYFYSPSRNKSLWHRPPRKPKPDIVIAGNVSSSRVPLCQPANFGFSLRG